MIRRITAALALLALCGCGDSSTVTYTCSDEIAAFEAEMGPAEEVTSYDDDAFHSRTYWYYRIGFARSFAWGNSVACTTGDSVFPPVKRLVYPLAEVPK